MTPVRRTWTIGGAGLVLTGVLGMLWAAAPGFGVMRYVVDVLFAASVLFLAVGLSREASVVRRRPLGMAALAVLAAWPFVVWGIDLMLPPLASSMRWDPARSVLANVDVLVSLAAALIAAVQIARAGTVPRRWRWAPLWALGVEVMSTVLAQVLLVAVIGPTQSQDLIAMANFVAQLGFLARTLGLGILALVLAAQVRPGSVEVIRSDSS